MTVLGDKLRTCLGNTKPVDLDDLPGPDDTGVVSDVVSTNIRNKTGEVPVKNSTEAITIQLPVMPILSTILAMPGEACGTKYQASCGWFDHVAKQWSTEGCQLKSLENGTANCECTHLTEFAVLLRERKCVDFATEERIVFLAFAVANGVLFGVALVQIVRLFIFARRKGACVPLNLLTAEHGLVLVAAALHTALLAIRSQKSAVDAMSIAGLILLSSLPFVLYFLAFTLLIFTWMALQHFAMSEPNSNP